jgi:hypothetical protein
LLLLGVNGSGKSSLLRLLAGLLAPAEGRLLWDGTDALADRAAHATRLRYLAHQEALKPSLTATENLDFFARLWGGTPAAALARLDLSPLADLPVRLLSAGQRRRLALARLALDRLREGARATRAPHASSAVPACCITCPNPPSAAVGAREGEPWAIKVKTAALLAEAPAAFAAFIAADVARNAALLAQAGFTPE